MLMTVRINQWEALNRPDGFEDPAVIDWIRTLGALVDGAIKTLYMGKILDGSKSVDFEIVLVSESPASADDPIYEMHIETINSHKLLLRKMGARTLTESGILPSFTVENIYVTNAEEFASQCSKAVAEILC